MGFPGEPRGPDFSRICITVIGTGVRTKIPQIIFSPGTSKILLFSKLALLSSGAAFFKKNHEMVAPSATPIFQNFAC